MRGLGVEEGGQGGTSSAVAATDGQGTAGCWEREMRVEMGEWRGSLTRHRQPWVTRRGTTHGERKDKERQGNAEMTTHPSTCTDHITHSNPRNTTATYQQCRRGNESQGPRA